MVPLAALLLGAATRPSMLRNATWAVSNLFRGKVRVLFYFMFECVFYFILCLSVCSILFYV
jgi:hypothetical protein